MSSLIAQQFIDHLLQQADIVEIIDYYVPLKKRGSNYLACCPFHNEKTPSFNVVASKQFYHCFGCGVSGNVISFIMSYLNLDFVNAIETLAIKLGLEIVREGGQQQIKQSFNLYSLLSRVNVFYQKFLAGSSIGNQYLQYRGINQRIVQLYEIGQAPDNWSTLARIFPEDIKYLLDTGMLIAKDDKIYDRYRGRLMFPLHNRNGKIIGFGGRALHEQTKPKYLNSPETSIFHKNLELYGLYQLLKHNNLPLDHIIIVEGYIDVIALAAYGFTNVVATLGTATNSYQIQVLNKYTNKLYFCFDGDDAGKKAAWRALENSLAHMNEDLEVKFIFLPTNHDPDSFVRQYGQKEFIVQLQQAHSLSRFLIDTLLTKLEINTLAGKSQLITKIKPFLEKIPEGTYKQLLLEELARLTRISSDRLMQQFNVVLKLEPEKLTDLKIIKRTPLNLAIALLLQHPNLYLTWREKINLDLLDDEQHKLLKKILLQFANLSGEPKVAVLIEPWRDTPYFALLCALSTWKHQISADVLSKEFEDIISFLQRQTLETKINSYLEKLRREGLSIEEKFLLQKMLKTKAQDKVNNLSSLER